MGLAGVRLSSTVTSRRWGSSRIRTHRPDCAVRSKVFVWLSIVTWDFEKPATLAAGAPVLRWQALQWHRATMDGSPEVVAWRAPQ